MVFPGEQDETWTYNETAGAWYFHRFYRFQPDLNISNPRVRDEIKKIASFWLRLGVSGFRMDAAPFVIEHTTPDSNSDGKDFGFLTELRQCAQWQRQDALLLAEANVDPDHRQDPEPVIDALRDTPALSLTSPIAAKDRRPGQRPERPVQQRLSVWTA
jgi:maltose alpha-D-glucosyltransferase / alpha-amylase